ncbi:alpha/beta fold hydrolase [Pseudonocardia hispaniensis]|uniref:Alpha/beta fold hydrolase n=1 Tax=Pseudonocardia hispaniensis TaxID=904933 RepID=A0ABW1IWJ4_9PSEU
MSAPTEERAASGNPLSALVEGARGIAGRQTRRVVNTLRLAGGLDRPQTGCSPHTVIWHKGRATLRHYIGGSGGRPVMLVPSLINRSHIWDMRPNDSFVQGLLALGYEVYLVDWGVADERDAKNTLSTYVDDYLPATFAAVEEDAGQPPVVVGHCFGGVVTTLWAASYPDQAAAVVCLGVPTNWLEMGPLAQMTRQGRLNPEDLLDRTGNLPPITLLRAFQMLKPLGDLTGYVTLWSRLDNREAAQAIWALTDWAHDHVPFPGATFVEMIRRISRENGLATGRVVLADRERKLADITVPFLNLYGTHDHVTPPPSVTPLGALVGSHDAETIAIKAGHIGLLVGSSARRRTLPILHEWLAARSLGPRPES